MRQGTITNSHGTTHLFTPRTFSRQEGGAQGEHKLARGFEPNQTGSIHWIYDNRVKDAVAKFLIREGIGVENYLSELNERNPFQN